MLIAGTDEAGRGPLVGPVVAAAVILDPNNPIEGLCDSKKLSEKNRNYLYDIIIEKALSYGIALCTAAEIDQYNILQASLMAMHRSVIMLSPQPDKILVDGNRCPKWGYDSEAIIKGDSKIPEISAASILAKVTRDRLLYDLDKRYPSYEFAKHKGYPTKAHMAVLAELGPIEEHRQSFGPVMRALGVKRD